MDLRYALRSLRKDPGFALIAVLVLALGIGANTAIFSVVNAVLLQPLSFKDPDRIVSVASLWKAEGARGAVSGPDFHDWHDQSTAFDAMAYYIGGEISVSVGTAAEYGVTMRVMPEFFRAMGVAAALGRLPAAEEQAPGGPPVAVVSHAFWQRRLGADPNAPGRTVRFGDRAFTVVGVLPRGFNFPAGAELWYPAATVDETESRSAHNYSVVARLKPGVSLEQAQTQMAAIASRLERQYPKSNSGKGASVILLKEQLVGGPRRMLFVLLAVVGVVLLIACANVANLLLARAMARTGEIAIRAALGASRARIVRQLLIESLVLAALAGAAGLALATWGIRALVALAPTGLPRITDVHMSGGVLVFTALSSLGASVLFGLAPGIAAARTDLNTALKTGKRGAVRGRSRRMSGLLVVGEIAACVVLVTGAGLLIRSFVALSDVDMGFRRDKVLVVKTSVPASDLGGARRATAFYRELLPRVAELPGIAAVAGVRGLPGGGFHSNGGYWLEGGPGPDETGIPASQALFSVVTPGYFTTLGIPLRSGRDFTERDGYDDNFVAVITEALVRKSFPHEDPLGKRIRCGLDSVSFMTIVGVAGDARTAGAASAPTPEIYMPYRQHPFFATNLNLLARTPGDPALLAEAIRRQVRDLNPEVPVKFSTMEGQLAESVAIPRFRTLLVGVFAGVALCLAMAGVYGLVAREASQRTGEFGLRIALGASPRDLFGLVMSHALKLAGAGLCLGLLGSVALTRILRSLLFAVQPGDPLTYLGVTALLGTVTLLAGYLPALRATRVDPVEALRAD